MNKTYPFDLFYKGLTPDEQVAICKMVEQDVDNFKQNAEWHGTLKATAVMMKVIDEETTKGLDKFLKSNKIPSCKKYCAHCCRMIVHISKEEGILIMDYVKKNNIKINKSLLDAQRGCFEEDMWEKLKFSKKKCIFLGKDKSCMIYPVRPSACRLYMVTDDPSSCSMRKNPQGNVTKLVINRAEYLSTVLINISPLEGASLPVVINRLMN